MTKIKPNQVYEYGVLTRAAESSGEAESTPRYAANSRNWPRQYAGEYFINTLGVETFEEYLQKNPEKIEETNRIVYFYEVDKDGQKQRVYSGNLYSVAGSNNAQPNNANNSNIDSGQHQRPTTGFTGGINNSGIPTNFGPQQGSQQMGGMPMPYPLSDGNQSQRPSHNNYGDPYANVRVRDFVGSPGSNRDRDIIELQRRNNELTTKINDLNAELASLRAAEAESRSRLLEAERQRINAEAEVRVLMQTKDADISAIRQQLQSQIDYQTKKHEDEIEMIKLRAVDTARREYEQLADDNQSGFDKLADLLPKLQPLLTPFMKLAEVGIDRLLSKPVAGGQGQPAQLPQAQQQAPQQTNANQQSAPSSQMPDFGEYVSGLPQEMM